MRLCESVTPGVTHGKRRIQANAQRCGALALDGLKWCAAHAKAFGYQRCSSCSAWMQPTGVTSKVAHTCPNGCAQPSIAPAIERKDPPF